MSSAASALDRASSSARSSNVQSGGTQWRAVQATSVADFTLLLGICNVHELGQMFVEPVLETVHGANMCIHEW